jgi:hypothetical protein
MRNAGSPLHDMSPGSLGSRGLLESLGRFVGAFSFSIFLFASYLRAWFAWLARQSFLIQQKSCTSKGKCVRVMRGIRVYDYSRLW